MDNLEAHQPSKKGRRFFYGYIVVIVAFVIMLVGFGLYNSFGVFIKPLLTEFGWTRALTSGSFSLSFILLGIIGIVWEVLLTDLVLGW